MRAKTMNTYSTYNIMLTAVTELGHQFCSRVLKNWEKNLE